jgi:hypothetical protein
LEAFFKALATNSLANNLEKCIFAILTLELLGQKISAAGSVPHLSTLLQSILFLPLRISSNFKDFSAW